jgi:hypothetical protein
MKINLNKSLKDLDGKEIDNSNMGKTIASYLAYNSKEGDAVKMWGWALKLNNNEELELDKSDFSTFKSLIIGSKGAFTVAFMAQFIEAIGEFKD